MPYLTGQALRDALAATPPAGRRYIAFQVGIGLSALDNIAAQRQPASPELAYRIAAQLHLSPRDLSPDLLADPADARTIRERRQVTGQKLGAFAYRCQVSRSHLDNVERGIRNPSPELLARIARLLRCRIYDIAAPSPAPSPGDAGPARTLTTAGAA